MARSQAVEFEGAHGDRLAARLDLPQGPPKAHALFAHCFTCSKDVFAAARISRGLTDLGYAVLRFDFTGLGSSEGDFANTNFSSNVQDLIAAANYLRQSAQAPALLVGHSLGGAATLAAAPQVPEAKAVATLAAPASPDHVKRLFADASDKIETQGQAEVAIAGRTFRIKKQFLEDIEEHKLEGDLRKLDKALLVCHSPIDRVVGIDNASAIFKAAKHPKSFLSLDDADHLLSRRDDAVYVANVIATWSARYIGQSSEQSKAARDEKQDAQPRAVTVSETAGGKFRQHVELGPHELVADEPVTVGGNDEGPSPYDLLLAALGTCTTMTLRLYADRKKLSLERTRVHLSHSKIHARDCENCETKEGKIDRIERVIALEGDLSTEERQRLLEIADKCPVHRTLHSEVSVQSSLADD